MPEITAEKFDGMLETQHFHNLKEWDELKENEIYTIIKYRHNPDNTMLLIMSEGINVWAPSNLVDIIVYEKLPLPYYIRPLGERFKNNYAFEFVVSYN